MPHEDQGGLARGRCQEQAGQTRGVGAQGHGAYLLPMDCLFLPSAAVASAGVANSTKQMPVARPPSYTIWTLHHQSRQAAVNTSSAGSQTSSTGRGAWLDWGATHPLSQLAWTTTSVWTIAWPPPLAPTHFLGSSCGMPRAGSSNHLTMSSSFTENGRPRSLSSVVPLVAAASPTAPAARGYGRPVAGS